MEEQPSLANDPTDEGRALGREVARLADAEFARDPTLRPRCHDCAFASGTVPNSIAGTLMAALKCAMEREPFYCHVTPASGRQRLCAGWEAMVSDEAVRAPWSHLEPAGDSLPHDPSQRPRLPRAEGKLRWTGNR